MVLAAPDVRRVTWTAPTGHRGVLGQTRYVGVPGSILPPGTEGSDVPTLARPAPLALPPVYRSSADSSAQGTEGYDQSGLFVPRRPAVFARCYGPEPLRIYLGINRGGRELGVIPCDNAQHELLGRAGSRPPADLTVFTGFLTAWRVDLGSVP